MGDALKKNMMGGLAWSTINIACAQFSQLIIGIILARILMPEDFGTFGLLYFFIGMSTVLIDGGFGQGLIRKKDATIKDFSTIFYFNFSLSVLLYLVLYFCAPLIAYFFEIPQLKELSRVLFLSVIVFSFYFIQQVQVLKKLDYKSLAIINIISVAGSGILAAIMAVKGFGIWALVYQQLSFHVFKAFIFPFFFKWKPIKAFTFSTINELLGFSIPLLGQTTLNVVFNNIYVLIMGKFYPIQQVGFYNQANRYSETVNTATTNILFTGTFPIFSQIQDDQPRLLRIYRKLAHSVSLVTFPLVAFLFVAAHPLIITLIEEKWLFSVVLFQILIVANLFTPLYTINVNVLNAKGQSQQTLKLEIFKKSLIFISIISCFSFGIYVLLVGFVVANFIAYAASMVMIKKSIAHYYRHQIIDFLSILVVVVIIGAVVSLIHFTALSNVSKLILESISFLTLYLIAVRFIFPESFNEVKDGVMNKVFKKR